MASSERPGWCTGLLVHAKSLATGPRSWVLGGLLVGLCGTGPLSGQGTCPNPDEIELVKLINSHRMSAGVLPLEMDVRLFASARGHTLDMTTAGFFDYTGSNGSSFHDRILAEGYPNTAVGEVIACANGVAQALGLWVASPSHQAVLLEPNFRHVGAGVLPMVTPCGPLVFTVDLGGSTAGHVQLDPVCLAAIFLRGDANSDGLVNIGDPIWTLAELFAGGPGSACRDASDSNDDGSIDIGDAIFSLAALFAGGPPPPPPGFMACGPDPTTDPLGCGVPPSCI